MNIKKNRATDEEIKEAITKGWSQMMIITKLKTHSQRVRDIRKSMNEDSDKEVKRSHSTYIFTSQLQDKFIYDCY